MGSSPRSICSCWSVRKLRLSPRHSDHDPNAPLWFGRAFQYDPSMSQLPVYCYQFDCLLSAFLPECHKHMIKRGVPSEMYLVSWFQTLFVYVDALPVETINRIWDIFMYEK